MKQNLLLGLMLLISFTGCARQVTTHTLQKGTKKVYVTEATIKVPEHETVHMSVEQQYKVVDETAEGYVLDIMVRDIQENKTTPPGLSVSAALSIMEGKHCQYATDKEGRVLRSLSREEVAEKYRENYFSVHEISTNDNDSTTHSPLNDWSEERELESLCSAMSPLALNGKNIEDGTEEEYQDSNGFMMKRTYHVNDDGSIQANAVMNMKDEDIRAFFQNMLKQVGLGITDEASEDLNEMIENFSMDYSEEATYTFLPDGWIKTIDCVITSKMAGQEPVTMTYKVYVK
jgi:hypothetical protein